MAKREPFMLFGTEHTVKLCKSCAASKEFLRRQSLMPVAVAKAAPPLSIKREFGAICYDCAAAETLRKFEPGLDWKMARIAIANDRDEKIRLPGAPLGLPFVRPSKPGDLQRLTEWQDRYLPAEEDRP